MADKAKEISAWCWLWYKKALIIDKSSPEWGKLVEEGIKAEKQFTDENDRKFFADMFLAFEARVERMSKRGVSE